MNLKVACEILWEQRIYSATSFRLHSSKKLRFFLISSQVALTLIHNDKRMVFGAIAVQLGDELSCFTGCINPRYKWTQFLCVP